MSGTSADGIDAVVARIEPCGRGLKGQIQGYCHRPFAPHLRSRIQNVGARGTVAELCALNFELGELFSRAALAVLRKANLRPADVVAIGSHGQTVYHLPNGRVPSTLQVGEAAVLAERTGIRVVADFRVADIAAGGQGAPLVTFADWALFSDSRRPRIIQNIGGIANLTFLPPRAGLGDVIAFDTGPGNMVIDAVVARLSAGRLSMDRGGKWAAQGRTSTRLVAEGMAHPFFRRYPPRTTGREEFGETFIRRLLASARRLKLAAPDVVASATALTAQSIAESCRRFVIPRLQPGEVERLQLILGGGGTKNLTLCRMLGGLLPEAELLTHEDFGIANAAKEALAFAVLARQTLLGRPGNVPSATGARRAVILGKIVTATGPFFV